MSDNPKCIRLSEVPDELLGNILSFLMKQSDVKTITSVASVSKKWQQTVDDETCEFSLNIWKRFCKQNGWERDIIIEKYDIPEDSSLYTVYQTAYMNNHPIRCEWLDDIIKEARTKRYYNGSSGVYIAPKSKEDQQRGPLRFFKEIPIRSPYFMHFYSGMDNTSSEYPEDFTHYLTIPPTLIYHPVTNRYACPHCKDTKKEKYLIFAFAYDRSHDWGTDFEYRCDNCDCYLFYAFYSGC